MYRRSSCFSAEPETCRAHRSYVSGCFHLMGMFLQKAKLIFAGLIYEVFSVVVYKDVKRRTENTAGFSGGALLLGAQGSVGRPPGLGASWLLQKIWRQFLQDCPRFQNIYSQTKRRHDRTGALSAGVGRTRPGALRGVGERPRRYPSSVLGGAAAAALLSFSRRLASGIIRCRLKGSGV